MDIGVEERGEDLAMVKTALITGITGQSGSYLADFLVDKGYKVYGLVRRSSNENDWRLHQCRDKVEFIYGEMTDQGSLDRAIQISRPDEVYNLAAMSFVFSSWQHPEQTMDVNAVGTLRILESIRKYKPDAKFYQASSSEMFGLVQETPQKETTPFHPRSPYGVSKVAAYWTTINYRESFNIFACNGILFNHESPRRGLEFVTKKISTGVAKIFLGSDEAIMLGNLDSKRDWGYAWDYVQAMWLMLNQEKPDDYVIATGETHSVREFVEESFRWVNMNVTWEGEGINEVGKVGERIVVTISKEFFRPAEVNLLLGDATKAKEKLGWKPECTFKELVNRMIVKDVERLRKK